MGPQFLRVFILGLALVAGLPRARADYKILVTSAKLEAKKRVGAERKPWDGGLGRKTAPDPYVVVEFDGAPVYVSGSAKDTTKPRWFTGTGYWPVGKSTPLRMLVRDADAGRKLSKVGMAGVVLNPQVPGQGRRFVNDLLVGVDTDDTIAIWSGTLGQLIALSGPVAGAEVDIFRASQAAQRFLENAGLTSLTVRVIERPEDFELGRPGKRKGGAFGVTSVRVEPRKRATGKKWDLGFKKATAPDLRYLTYVNGEPVQTGAIFKDSFAASWTGELPRLDLRPDDTIAISILDADGGTLAAKAGQHALLFSSSLSDRAKGKLFEELNSASTDDVIFLWVGSWARLQSYGMSFPLPRGKADPQVWINNGLQGATITTL